MNRTEEYARAAALVQKIAEGVKPGDIQPFIEAFVQLFIQDEGFNADEFRAICMKDEPGPYILVGGKPFGSYTGTQTFTGLKVIAAELSESAALRLRKQHYEECGGLLIIVNAETGEELKE